MSASDLTPDQAAAVARGRATSERLMAEARLVGQFDALYEAGGVPECLRVIMLLSERLAERMRKDAARGFVAGDVSGWVG